MSTHVPHDGRLGFATAIDSLVLRGTGQAVQRFNLMFGIEETTGLLQAPATP